MGNIYFGGPMDYNMAVYNVYAKIAENPVGQVIIDAINRTKKDLTFELYNKGEQPLYGDNAITAPDDWRRVRRMVCPGPGMPIGTSVKKIILTPGPTSAMI